MTLRSGFVGMFGRPNVGKSSLINALLKQKVSITSAKPQTTRQISRGVLHRPDAQIVFVDTPGIHKPVSVLGQRLNSHATSAVADVDIFCFLLDASQPSGRGDEVTFQMLLKILHKAKATQKSSTAHSMAQKSSIAIVTKSDKASRATVAAQLLALSQYHDFDEYVATSAVTGEGLATLEELLAQKLPCGPGYFDSETVRDSNDAVWVAELVREQLLSLMREELPYSVAARVTQYDWPDVICEILVERQSQKGMVIGKGGKILTAVRSKVEPQLPRGTKLRLKVKVLKNWQNNSQLAESLGY